MNPSIYETPALTVLGTVAELTEGGSQGGTDFADGNGSQPELK